MMDKGISEIVGRGDLTGGKSIEVYRALRALLCATCGASIAQDALFTRRKVKGIGLRIMPQCAKCVPFTLRTESKGQAGLLQSLLTEPLANSSKRVTATSHVDSQADIESPNIEKNPQDEVRRRLEPALKRSQRGRFKK
jgi:hypothetical protein